MSGCDNLKDFTRIDENGLPQVVQIDASDVVFTYAGGPLDGQPGHAWDQAGRIEIPDGQIIHVYRIDGDRAMANGGD